MKKFALLILILLGLNLYSQIQVLEFDESETTTINSALNLIQSKDQHKWQKLNRYCKRIILSKSEKSLSTIDSTIVISEEDIRLGSNKLALIIVRESKRLELRIGKWGYSNSQEDYACYTEEYSFCCKIECDGELKKEIIERVAETSQK
jgi:hypothetical protein